MTNEASTAGSVMVAAIEAAYADVCKRHAELPPVIVVLGDGGTRKDALLGQFAGERWELRAGGVAHELVVTTQRLRDGGEAVLETVLHEAAHALLLARGVVGTSRGGRYHNARFREAAIELGLDCGDKPGTHGWAVTELPQRTAMLYRRTVRALDAAIAGHTEWKDPLAPQKPRQSQVRGWCQCGRVIRASAAAWDEARIICEACGEPFAPDSAAMLEYWHAQDVRAARQAGAGAVVNHLRTRGPDARG